jgi:hypothetical protein
LKNRHIVIDAAQIEFHEGGNTLWVHSPNGATVLRIKLLKGQFLVNDKCENIVSHADMQIPEGDVVICLKEKEVR